MITSLLHDVLIRHPTRNALRFGEQEWTYSHLFREAKRIAGGLRARGVRSGDRVAFLLNNGPEIAMLNLACLTLGAVAVPMNVRLKGPEFAYILDHSEACVAIAHADLYANLASVRNDRSHLRNVVIVGGIAVPEGCEAYRDLPTDAGEVTWFAGEASHPAAILYTSGTTARPKGVTHSLGTLAATVRQYAQAVRLKAEDAVFGMLSLSHIFGYTLQLLSPLSVGATVLIAPSFDPPHVLEAIGKHHVTHLYGLPVMFDALCREAPEAKPNLDSLRYCLAGGDAVSAQLSAAMRNHLGVDLHEGCGMTEVIPYALNRLDIPNRIGSIGPPSVGMHVRIADETGRELGTEAIGEMQVKSEAVMAGYWNDPEATASAMQDGWFRTGDLGRRDADGYLWFCGRSKEIIVRGGSNVSPLEVEIAVGEHPAVREVAVVGLPHPTLGEIVAAFVVLKPGEQVAVESIRKAVGERIAAYKVPDQVTFLDELPRGATGKVHRKSLKASFGKPGET
jgi:long-chain acyl-CoA synthetase